MANAFPNAFPAVTGYVGSLWNADRLSLTYANATMQSLTAPNQLVLAEALAETLRNSRDAIDAFILSSSAFTTFLILNPTLAVPSGLDPFQIAFIQNRISAIQAFAFGTTTLDPPPSVNPSAALAAGGPAIGDPQFFEYLVGFLGEAIPVGLTVDNFVDVAAVCAGSWLFYGDALLGLVPNNAIDQINYMTVASLDTYFILANIALAPDADLTVAWNQLVAIPGILRFLSSNAIDPTSLVSQQTACMRNLICTCLYNTYTLVANLQQFVPTTVATVTIRNNDSLMSIAARVLGDYTQWQSIAQANNLLPPYIAATASPGVAGWGQTIYLPVTSGTQTNVPAASYEATYLGTDLWYGSINSDMIVWTGDFQTIASYQNLAFSLGRRLQTTLGTLIYHSDFGSRIPPEIGAVATSNTLGYLGAYAESALASDSRVSQVLSVTVNATSGYLITIVGSVLPNGPSGKAYNVSVNASIGAIVPGLAVP